MGTHGVGFVSRKTFTYSRKPRCPQRSWSAGSLIRVTTHSSFLGRMFRCGLRICCTTLSTSFQCGFRALPDRRIIQVQATCHCSRADAFDLVEELLRDFEFHVTSSSLFLD